MKALVFGSSGLVGDALMNHFLNNGIEALGISSSGAKNSFALNISDPKAFEQLDFIPDVIINCASKIPDGSPSSDPVYVQKLFLTNVLGGVNICNWAIQKKVPKVINCSTLSVVKKPWPVPLTEDFKSIPDGFHAAYGMSKLCQEQLMNEVLRGSETKIIHARLSAVYGLDMRPEGIIFTLLKKLLAHQDVSLYNAEITSVDLISVEEISLIFTSLIEKDFDNQILNVASGNPITILQLAQKLKDISGSNSKIFNEEKGGEPNYSEISIQKLKQLISVQEDSEDRLNEGLKQLTQKYKNENLSTR